MNNLLKLNTRETKTKSICRKYLARVQRQDVAAFVSKGHREGGLREVVLVLPTSSSPRSMADGALVSKTPMDTQPEGCQATLNSCPWGVDLGFLQPPHSSATDTSVQTVLHSTSGASWSHLCAVIHSVNSLPAAWCNISADVP